MCQNDHEKLEYGRELQKSTNLIECRAIVEYDDGLNWQGVHAYILPKAINSEGYVREVWIASESVSIQEQKVNGKVYSLLCPDSLQYRNKTRIDRFEIHEQKPVLLPSPDLIVRYMISPSR